MSLKPWIIKCVGDTREYVGASASNALMRGVGDKSEEELVGYVQRLIRSPNGQVNAFEIDLKKGVSLESIVIDHCPELFDTEDKEIAAKTLGRN